MACLIRDRAITKLRTSDARVKVAGTAGHGVVSTLLVRLALCNSI